MDPGSLFKKLFKLSLSPKITSGVALDFSIKFSKILSMTGRPRSLLYVNNYVTTYLLMQVSFSLKLLLTERRSPHALRLGNVESPALRRRVSNTRKH
jgi:hypothetical protein